MISSKSDWYQRGIRQLTQPKSAYIYFTNCFRQVDHLGSALRIHTQGDRPISLVMDDLHLVAGFLEATFNEESNIASCIESMKDVVDEIVVVDSFSKDSTVEICEKKGVTVYKHPFNGHIQQKNYCSAP